MTPQQLAQAAQDLALAEAQLRATGIVLAGIAYAMADSLKAQAKEARAARRATGT